MSTPTVSDIINLFDVDNQITNIRGSFRYRFFDPIEQIDEFNRFANDPQKSPKERLGMFAYNGNLRTRN